MRILTGFERKRVSIDCSEGRGAVQSFKEECDINNIMRKAQRTGAVTWLNKHEGRYADVTGLDFMESMQTIIRAQDMFDDLPSSVRSRFHNDPGEFLEFMHDPENSAEMVKLGLATARPSAEPQAPVMSGSPAGGSATS